MDSVPAGRSARWPTVSVPPVTSSSPLLSTSTAAAPPPPPNTTGSRTPMKALSAAVGAAPVVQLAGVCHSPPVRGAHSVENACTVKSVVTTPSPSGTPAALSTCDAWTV